MSRIVLDKRYREGTTLTAMDLAARMIGSVVTFAYRMPRSALRIQVIGEFRQMSVGGSTVSVLVSSHDMDSGAVLEEFELELDHEITFLELM